VVVPDVDVAGWGAFLELCDCVVTRLLECSPTLRLVRELIEVALLLRGRSISVELSGGLLEHLTELPLSTYVLLVPAHDHVEEGLRLLLYVPLVLGSLEFHLQLLGE
jgi:hypothetical protein